jgi:hypothetical protein
MSARADRIARIVSGVIRAALRESGRCGIVIVADGSPETGLLCDWCRVHLAERVWGAPDTGELRRLVEERNALAANPVNKTTLLLGAAGSPEPLLPLGDLYATQISDLAGGWSAPPEVQQLIATSGGIELVDQTLQAWFEGWTAPETAVQQLPAEARGPFLEAVRAGRFWRERAGLVPKLSARTIGVDLIA